MAYLDVAPMMTALRTTPTAFDMNGAYLRHIPSRHEFLFDRDGHVQIRALCNCAHLAVKSDQEQGLFAAFNHWRTQHWQPAVINREFASHFRARAGWRRLLVRMTGRLHQWALREPERRHEQETFAPAPLAME